MTDYVKYLDKFYGDWAGGLCSRAEMEGNIYSHILKHYWVFGIKSTDAGFRSDFLSWYYTRMKRVIDRYRGIGAFSGFFIMNLRYAFRDYCKNSVIQKITEQAVWSERIRENEEVMAAADVQASYGNDHDDYGKIKNPRQVLILLLKCYHHVDDNLINYFAPKINMEPERLADLLSEVRAVREKKEDQREMLREKTHTLYYRCFALRKRLAECEPGSNTSRKLEAELSIREKRLAAARKKLAELGTGASNSEVARVMGLTKGTIDSMVHTLRKYSLKGRKKHAT